MLLMMVGLNFLVTPPKENEVKMYFDNGTWLTSQKENLLIEATDTNQVYTLYCDGKLVQEINPEDWQLDRKFNYSAKEVGYYTLYDENDKLCAKALYFDENKHIFFDQAYIQIDDMMVFNQKTQVACVALSSENLFEDLDYQTIGQWDIYETVIDQEGLSSLFETYKFYLDTKKPQVTYEFVGQEPYVDHDGVYFINSKDAYLNVWVNDEGDTFLGKESWEKCENGYQYQYHFQEGKQEIDIFKDSAGNSGATAITVIYDTNFPQLDIPNDDVIFINQKTGYTISDAYLDMENTKIELDGLDIKGNCLKVEQGLYIELDNSGLLHIDAKDQAGNQTEIEKYIVFDNVQPKVTPSQNEQLLQLTIEEENLANESMTLKLNDTTIDLEKTDEGYKAQVNQDGIYHWQGQVIDKANNMTDVDIQMPVDIFEPTIINENDNQTVYTKPLSLTYIFDDVFLEEWQIDVYRNQNYLKSYHGNTSTCQIDLDDTQFNDGFGQYTLVASASDGVHQSTLTKDFSMDMTCAPLNVYINDAFANNVTHMSVVNDISCEATCDEGVIEWQLYNGEELLEKEVADTFLLTPHSDATHMTITSMDNYQHTNTQTITLAYPKIEEVLNEKIIQEEKHLPKQEQMEMKKPIIIKMQSQDRHSHIGWIAIIVIGGVVLALDIMRRKHISNLQSSIYEEDLLDTKTVVLNNSEPK